MRKVAGFCGWQNRDGMWEAGLNLITARLSNLLRA